MNNPVEIFKRFMTMGKDPKQIEEMIYQQNPQLRVLANQMKQSGLTPVEFVMQYAKQNNIPIQENSVKSMFQQMQNMTPKQ
jgi:argininosuccinate synthase